MEEKQVKKWSINFMHYNDPEDDQGDVNFACLAFLNK